MSIDLIGLPWGAAPLIERMLADRRCTTDHVLIVADAVSELANAMPDDASHTADCTRIAAQLREIAPEYARK